MNVRESRAQYLEAMIISGGGIALSQTTETYDLVV